MLGRIEVAFFNIVTQRAKELLYRTADFRFETPLSSFLDYGTDTIIEHMWAWDHISVTDLTSWHDAVKGVSTPQGCVTNLIMTIELLIIVITFGPWDPLTIKTCLGLLSSVVRNWDHHAANEPVGDFAAQRGVLTPLLNYICLNRSAPPRCQLIIYPQELRCHGLARCAQLLLW